MTEPLLCASILLSFFMPRRPFRRASARDADQVIARGREALAAGKFDEAAGPPSTEAVKPAGRGPRGPDPARARELQRGRDRGGEEHRDDEAVDALTKAEEAARKAVESTPLGAPARGRSSATSCTRAGNVEEAIASLYQAEKLGERRRAPVDLADDLSWRPPIGEENGDDAGAAARVARRSALERAQKLAGDQVLVARRLAHVCTMAERRRRDAGRVAAGGDDGPADTELHEALIEEAVAPARLDDAIRFYSGLVDEPAMSHWYASRARELKGNWLFNEAKDFPRPPTSTAGRGGAGRRREGFARN